MRFHEAVAAMAQGSCCKSQWGAIHKYDPKEGGFCWMNERWMKEGIATHETIGNWEIVPDPSAKPLDFFGAMEALKAGKCCSSGFAIYKFDGRGLALWCNNVWLKTGISYSDQSSEWFIVPIPEATNA